MLPTPTARLYPTAPLPCPACLGTGREQYTDARDDSCGLCDWRHLARCWTCGADGEPAIMISCGTPACLLCAMTDAEPLSVEWYRRPRLSERGVGRASARVAWAIELVDIAARRIFGLTWRAR